MFANLLLYSAGLLWNQASNASAIVGGMLLFPASFRVASSSREVSTRRTAWLSFKSRREARKASAMSGAMSWDAEAIRKVGQLARQENQKDEAQIDKRKSAQRSRNCCKIIVRESPKANCLCGEKAHQQNEDDEERYRHSGMKQSGFDRIIWRGCTPSLKSAKSAKARSTHDIEAE